MFSIDYKSFFFHLEFLFVKIKLPNKLSFLVSTIFYKGVLQILGKLKNHAVTWLTKIIINQNLWHD